MRRKERRKIGREKRGRGGSRSAFLGEKKIRSEQSLSLKGDRNGQPNYNNFNVKF